MMWLKILGGIAMLLFVICVVAVLQGWSKSTMSGRVLGVFFIIVLGFAALWGIRTVLGHSE